MNPVYDPLRDLRGVEIKTNLLDEDGVSLVHAPAKITSPAAAAASTTTNTNDPIPWHQQQPPHPTTTILLQLAVVLPIDVPP